MPLARGGRRLREAEALVRDRVPLPLRGEPKVAEFYLAPIKEHVLGLDIAVVEVTCPKWAFLTEARSPRTRPALLRRPPQLRSRAFTSTFTHFLSSTHFRSTSRCYLPRSAYTHNRQPLGRGALASQPQPAPG